MARVRRAGLSAVGVALILTAGACSKESKQEAPAQTQSPAGQSTAPESAQAAADRGQALVRVVNAAPEVRKIDVHADNAPLVTDVSYKAVTPYKEVSASADDFAITPTGKPAGEPIAENSESIMSGRHYTLIAYPANEPGKLDLQVVSDDLQPPSEGKARVRIVNASTAAPTVAVFARGEKDPLFSDVDFKENISYKEIDPKAATIELRSVTRDERMAREPGPVASGAEQANRARDAAADNGRGGDRNIAPSEHAGEPVIATTRLAMEAGKSYTVILTGQEPRNIDAIVIEDSVPAPGMARRSN